MSRRNNLDINYHNRPCHVEVTIDECGNNEERMIRKFLKKLHKSGVQKEVISRRAYVKPSKKRHDAKREQRHRNR